LRPRFSCAMLGIIMSDIKMILLIEDDQFLSLLLKGRLEKEGFTVAQAFDGEEGLASAKDKKPDLIVLDLIMPKLSGFEFLETISADPQLRQIPVVVATNLGQESDIQKIKSFGVVDYFVKAQTSVEDLVRIFKGVLERQGAPKEA